MFAGGLNPPSTATTVDNTGDTPLLTDGPFVEAKEASRALQSRVEVRSLQERPDA